MSRDQGYSPLDFEHHSLGGEDEDLHDEHYVPHVEVTGAPIERVSKMPGRVCVVFPGSRPPPLVRQIILCANSFSSSIQQGVTINFGAFTVQINAPTSGAGPNANYTNDIIGPFDFDIEVSEFSITYQNPAAAISGSLYALFITAPGK
jgi:hypothetical protein